LEQFCIVLSRLNLSCECVGTFKMRLDVRLDVLDKLELIMDLII